MHVFVEGPDDVRLLGVVLKKCYSQYTSKLYKFVNSDSNLVKEHIKILKEKKEPCILITDMDNYTSITERKKQRSKEYDIEFENVIVVKKSIESWYAAGAPTSLFQPQGNHSETIDKIKFNQLIGRSSLHTRIMVEISEDFDTGRAVSNNKSFKYFYRELKNLLKPFENNKNVSE
ncbi:MAG: hypothetical protein K5790_04415 [Nitrosopumilus sp.]|uniref:hypothetical protein n=1 Tax=Nitrosopumilus sp. TaxID=2024843 RepID=UPI00247E6FE9|nr:hypothetical protein [Nitrosopumilus sp.]MCV0392523.1 hypothetical protein [Nitrosopumilus sp.]